VDWINLAQGGGKWWDLVVAVTTTCCTKCGEVLDCQRSC